MCKREINDFSTYMVWIEVCCQRDWANRTVQKELVQLPCAFKIIYCMLWKLMSAPKWKISFKQMKKLADELQEP